MVSLCCQDAKGIGGVMRWSLSILIVSSSVVFEIAASFSDRGSA
jgi:hypothetical protein